MLGLTLAYFLSRRGKRVTVFEARERPGGLLDWFDVDGVSIDKFYHCILGSDADLLALIDEIGLADRLRLVETRQGFYREGSVYPMAGAKDFLLFPPLSMVERFRLGLTVLSAMREKDWHRIDQVGVEAWLIGLGGRGTFEKVWKPLLRAKFDGDFSKTPATYIWSRLSRTAPTRATARQSDRMGYLVGGGSTLVRRLVERIEQAGSEVRSGSAVCQLLVESGEAVGVRTVDGDVSLDAVVVTAPLPALSSILPGAYSRDLGIPADPEYLGVVSGVVLLDRRLTPFYTLNIADEGIPFTGLIETTNLISPGDVGGYHLVYLPKYVAQGNPFAELSDDELRRIYIRHLGEMFPGFSESWVRHIFVHRETLVEPLHLIGKPRPVMPMAPNLPGLFVVNTGQIYPELTNCQSSVRHALKATPLILDSVPRSAS